MRDFIASENSARLRQRLSRATRVREPAAFTKLACSVVDIALITGITARLYRAVILSRASASEGAYLASLGAGAIFLLGMAAIHLTRFPVRQWPWRAPLFAILEGAVEMLVSLALIAAHRETLGVAPSEFGQWRGTTAAEFSDWPALVLGTLGWRLVIISLFALLLAGIVSWVRYLRLRRGHQGWAPGTVRAGLPGENFVDRRRSAAAKTDLQQEIIERRRQSAGLAPPRRSR